MDTLRAAILNETRRQFFARTARGLGCAALGTLIGEQLRASTDGGAAGLPHFAPKAKRAVYMHMLGGPPQQDMFDYKPELLKRWGMGPAGWSLVECEIDLKVGGKWRFVMHGTGGSSEQFLRPDFSGELFREGGLLDASRYFIVLPDGIGHGLSSKPSDGLRAKFPRYGYDDMIVAQQRLLTEALRVNHLRLVMGTSMGGMHTWLWGQRYPDFMDALLPLASLPAQISGRNRLATAIAGVADREREVMPPLSRSMANIMGAAFVRSRVR